MAATGAFAQSSVQIDGVMDAGLQSIDYKGTRVNGIANNGSSTSQINFRGTEDLGGGLKANFRVETDWNTVSNKGNTGNVPSATMTGGAASTFGNGELRVGLSGKFGAIDMGAVNYNTLGTYLTGQPFGTAIGSGFNAVYVNDGQGRVRSDNSVKYVSPSFSGLTASLYYAGKQTKAPTTAFSTTFGAYDMQGTTELGLNYANGPLAASFSTLKQDYKEVGGVVGYDQTINTLGANYAFGAAKLFGLYQTNKSNTSSFNNKTFSISGTYTMGAVVLMAQAGQLKDVADKKSKLFALGADYNLSKRTAVYARYESIDDKATVVSVPFTAVNGETTRTRTAVGVRHAF